MIVFEAALGLAPAPPLEAALCLVPALVQHLARRTGTFPSTLSMFMFSLSVRPWISEMVYRSPGQTVVT